MKCAVFMFLELPNNTAINITEVFVAVLNN